MFDSINLWKVSLYAEDELLSLTNKTNLVKFQASVHAHTNYIESFCHSDHS